MGKRGFRLTIAGGTSILPDVGVSALRVPRVEQCVEVAEAIVRVYHRFGDYQHRQRIRDEVSHPQLRWDAWRQKFDEVLAEVKAEGGVPFDGTAAAADVEQAPDWTLPPAPSIDAVKRMAASAARSTDLA